MEDKKSVTDPRVQRTRRLIREAFVELLQEMDVEKISVNRIAEKATIHRVTFYLHYRDIPDMMEKMADEMIENIERILYSPRGSDDAASEAAELPLVKLLTHIEEHARFYKVILASKRLTIFTDRLLKLITDMSNAKLRECGNDSLLSGKGIVKEIAVWYDASALIGTVVAWLRKDMPYTPQFLAEQIAAMRSHSLIGENEEE